LTGQADPLASTTAALNRRLWRLAGLGLPPAPLVAGV